MRNQLHAEGTKQIQPTPASHGRLQIMPYVTNFAIFDATQEHRLHITICQAGEKILYGFGNIRDYYGNVQYDVIYRIKDPNGNVVVGPAPLPYSGQGFIPSYYQAVNGPDVINTAGYNALVYTPTILGDYYIEFSFTQPYGFERKIFDAIDITVVSATNQEKPGRLWSKNWQLTTNPMSGYSSPYQAGYDGIMYIYSDDGVVTSVDLNNMQPFVFNITANQSGCFNTGNFFQDRKSADGNNTYPQYRIFLNNPDILCFPTGQFGSITAPTTITGCPGQFCVNISVDKPGNVEVVLELNGIPGFQPNTEDVIFTYNVTPGLNCIPWSGLNGLGDIVAAGQTIQVEIDYFNGLTHLPLYDVEGNLSGYKVQIIRPVSPNPTPALFWDDTNIPGGAAQFLGCTAPNGCHTWPIGTCLNSPLSDYCSLGDMRTINTWWYANNIKDTALVLFEYPLVNANIFTPPGQNDTLICIENGSIQLNGGIQFAPSGTWTGTGGQFSPNANSLQAVYTFSPSEISNASAILVLTSVGSTCPSATDTMRITIVEAQVNVIPDTTVCRGNSIVLSANGGQTYLWAPAATLNNAQTESPIATPINNTTYTVNILDSNGCSASNSVVVSVEDVPDIDFVPDDTSGCKPLKINFLSMTTFNLNQYNWDFGNPSAGWPNNSQMPHPSYTYNTPGTYSVSLTVTSAAGCTNQITYPDLIKVFPQPEASFYHLPREGDSENMLFSFIDESTNASLWHWNFGDIASDVDNVSDLQNPQHQYNQTGVYEVWLNVTSPDGCIDSSSRDIIIRGEFTLYVPNAFTPNLDGQNEFFMPYGIELNNNKFLMYIFNRWGELVFMTEDVNDPWYGDVMKTGVKAPQDVYVWIIFTQNSIIGRQKYVGHVSLIR
ncbi:MAG: PKD domain-containing protein [Bacteroidales bacterium]|nr:PKD domain-containing protein [Bacteroidales bacterium]